MSNLTINYWIKCGDKAAIAGSQKKNGFVNALFRFDHDSLNTFFILKRNLLNLITHPSSMYFSYLFLQLSNALPSIALFLIFEKAILWL